MEECMGVNEGIEEETGNPVLKGDEEEEATGVRAEST